MTTFLWLLVLAGGPLLIALALAYGMMRSRRLTGVEKRAREDAIERLYGKKNERDRVSPDMEPRSR
jgi:hypothetical protein